MMPSADDDICKDKLKNILFHDEQNENADPEEIESIKGQLAGCSQGTLMAIHLVAQEYLESSKKNKKPRTKY